MLVAMFGVLFIMQLLLIVLVSVQAGVRLLQARADVRLEVSDAADDTKIQEFYTALRGLSSVADVQFINKDQAYAREKARDPGLVAFLEKYDLENPFPSAFAITLTSLDGYTDLAGFVSSPVWSTVIEPSSLAATTSQHTQLLQMLSFLDAVWLTTTVFLVVAALTLLAVGTALVHHRVLQRSEAITLQCLLGGRPFDVLFPFVWETTVLLFSAVVLSGVFIGAFIILLPDLFPDVAGDPLFSSFMQEGAVVYQTALPVFWILEILLCPLLAAACVMLGAQWKPASPLKTRR